ncbi:MAG: cation:proton antiporter [Spirochaetales bacterium]
MGHVTVNEPLVILVIAAVLFFAMLGRSAARKIGLPGMVAFLLIGIGINGGFAAAGGLPESLAVLFDVLGTLGVVALLFQAGMHTDVTKLVKQLGPVCAIWAANVVIAGGAGFAVARWIIDLSLIPSLVIAVALTATSVGISVAVWEGREAEQSKDGRLFLGIASLDDISAVVLMAILFAIMPVLRDSSDAALLPTILTRLGWTLAKLVAFAALCLLFSRYLEHRLREGLQRFESPAAALVSVVAISIIIAAVAGLLGFSVAIGAFLAGLAFSGDPAALRQHIAFDTIYDLFVPFFFIGIGLSLELGVALEALVPGLLLLAAAVVGKLLANWGVARFFTSATGAAAIGVSMVPRAEITMIVMDKARGLGDWAAPTQAYAGMVFVSLVTAIVAPLILRGMIERVRRE